MLHSFSLPPGCPGPWLTAENNTHRRIGGKKDQIRDTAGFWPTGINTIIRGGVEKRVCATLWVQKVFKVKPRWTMSESDQTLLIIQQKTCFNMTARQRDLLDLNISFPLLSPPSRSTHTPFSFRLSVYNCLQPVVFVSLWWNHRAD